jgi:NAD(P)H-dependent flavin oxidoreductase YrpB (nitropropane dioxygenase family)
METRFTQMIGCRYPIQQAGMGGVATPELAAAVARAGGLGMIGGARWPASRLVEALDALDADTRRGIGVNFLMPFLDREAMAVAAERVRVVEFFYGDPTADLVKVVHEKGALAAWQVGSLEEAKQAEAAGCDFIIAQGIEGGGHIRGRIGLLGLLDQVLPAVKLPVVAAGGIGTGRGVAAVLAAGAAAARLGTRFLAAAEANIHPVYQAALFAALAEDTVITEAFGANWPNAPHRVLRSSLQAAQAHPEHQVGETIVAGQTMPIQRFASPCPTRSTTGKIEAMALYAGESVGSVRAVQLADEIIRDLMATATACLK